MRRRTAYQLAFMMGLSFAVGCASQAQREESKDETGLSGPAAGAADISQTKAAGCTTVPSTASATGASERFATSSLFLADRVSGASQSLKAILDSSQKPVLVIDFVSPNCFGCIEKMEKLEAAKATSRGQYFHYVIAVPDTSDEQWTDQEIDAFVNPRAPSAPKYKDLQGATWKASSVQPNTPILPTIVVVNTLGNAVKVNQTAQVNAPGAVAQFVLPAIDSLASEACQ